MLYFSNGLIAVVHRSLVEILSPAGDIPRHGFVLSQLTVTSNMCHHPLMEL